MAKKRATKRTAAKTAKPAANRITRDESGQLVHFQYKTILRRVQAGVAPFLVGPAGSGKTTAAQNVANALGAEFYYSSRVESEYQLRGFMDAHGKIVDTDFCRAYRDGGLFLFDEIDASEAQALVAVNAALSNGSFDAPGGKIKRHDVTQPPKAGPSFKLVFGLGAVPVN